MFLVVKFEFPSQYSYNVFLFHNVIYQFGFSKITGLARSTVSIFAGSNLKDSFFKSQTYPIFHISKNPQLCNFHSGIGSHKISKLQAVIFVLQHFTTRNMFFLFEFWGIQLYFIFIFEYRSLKFTTHLNIQRHIWR